MGFNRLVKKVKQAEDALEAKERRLTEHWHHLKDTWHDTWTPGRIIIAGLIAGFVAGATDPLKAVARSGNLVQLLSLIPNLFASTAAQAAASEASEAASAAEGVAEAVAPEAANAARAPAPASNPVES